MSDESRKVFITSQEDSLIGDDGGPAVYFCVRLSPEALHRADVLEGLSETCGMASLPSGISNDDFLLWKNSSPCSVEMSTTQLTRILQVADALADKRLPDWARVLAERVAATSWDVPDACEDIHCALLSLQHPIRHAVMQALIALQPPSHALLTLPHTLHSSLAAALISPLGTLVPATYRPSALQILLTHLPTLPAAGQPALRSLDLSRSSMTPSSCHLLGETLSSHSRLTEILLHLTDCGTASLGCIEALTSALPATSSLRKLSLSHAALSEASLSHLTRSLPSLPALLSLTLATITPTATPAHTPTPTVDAPARPDDPDRPLVHFMHAVAAHPAITHLSLSTADVPFSHTHLPISFPLLQHLHLDLSFAHTPPPRTVSPTPSALAAAAETHAPFPALKRLDFMLRALCPSARWTASAVQRMLPLHAESAACPHMRTLRLGVHTDEFGSDEWEQAIWNALSGSLWPCPHLAELSIECDNATAAIHVAAAQLRRRTGLTALCLNGLWTEHDPHAWASFFGSLAPLHRLQRLRLGPYHAASQGLTARLTEAVGNFRQLRELSLHGGGPQDSGEAPVLRCDILATGLRAASTLRVLGLHDVALVVPRELWGALRSLTLLQELRVSFCQVDEGEAAPLAAVLPRLAALTALDLEGNQLAGPGALTVAAALFALPRLRVADLGMNEIDEEYDEDIAVVQADLAARSITLSLDAVPTRDL
eukprot:jgi/Ulvmu1/8699/UM047_0039.1